MSTPSALQARQTMVTSQLVHRGITDANVLDAMRCISREDFVSRPERPHAYEDRPLPIGFGQTISQPFIVAYMIEALRLRGGEKILEIGSGSGYAAAVLARIADHVVTLERLPELADLAQRNLASAGIRNVTVHCADGTRGWPGAAPFDAILVSAGAPELPRALMDQVKIGGSMVVPVGPDPTSQDLTRVVRTAADTFEQTMLTSVRFVPLIGQDGWQPQDL